MGAPLMGSNQETFKREGSLSLGDRLYWGYYIHLPFFLMTNGEAFALHTVVFLVASFFLYIGGLYLPAIALSLAGRVGRSVAGDDVLHAVRALLPYYAKQYMMIFDPSWSSFTEMAEKVLS